MKWTLLGWGQSRGFSAAPAVGSKGKTLKVVRVTATPVDSRRGWWRASWPLAALASLTLTACAAKKPDAPPAPLVAVSRPLQKDIVDWDDYVGRFEGIQDVQVRPRVSGQITKIAFREGVEVKQGQFLFE